MSKVVVKAAGEKGPKRVRTKSLREEMREWKENRNRGSVDRESGVERSEAFIVWHVAEAGGGVVGFGGCRRRIRIGWR